MRFIIPIGAFLSLAIFLPFIAKCQTQQYPGATGTGTGVAPFSCTVTAVTSIACTHNLGTSTPWVVCFDGSGNELGSTGATTSVTSVVATSASIATITFSGSTTGICKITSGSMGPTGLTGATGSTGIAGTAGTNGTNGTTTNGGIDCPDATGSTTVYTCPTPTPTPGSYATGALVAFKPQATNTSTGPTLNVAALGAKNLKGSDGGTLAIGALVGGTKYLFEYDGTSFVQQAGGGSGGSDGAWINVTVKNGWTTPGSGHDNASYKLDSHNRVQLRGSLVQGTTTSGTPLFTLPLGFRPVAIQDIMAVQYTGGSGFGFCWISVQTNGDVQYLQGNGVAANGEVSIAGLSFSLDP
jgi:hypothetical protein